jgi:hypothetical protein
MVIRTGEPDLNHAAHLFVDNWHVPRTERCFFPRVVRANDSGSPGAPAALPLCAGSALFFAHGLF